MREILDRERDLHMPVINPVSDEIAARLPQTARERLYSHKTDYSRLQLADSRLSTMSPPRQRTRHASASGVGSRRRSRSAPGMIGGCADADTAFYRRGERRREQAGQRLENLRRAQEAKAMAECTFSPATCMHAVRRIDPLAVHDRGTQWQKRREQKLHEERTKREDVELAHCTFAPNLPDDPDAGPAHDLPEALPCAWEGGPDTQLYGGDGRAWGYDEFVERHREARRRLMEKQDAAWKTGKGWTNEVTVPLEFNLGRRESVAALQKPLSPPANQPRYREPPRYDDDNPMRGPAAEWTGSDEPAAVPMQNGLPWEYAPAYPVNGPPEWAVPHHP